MNIFLVQPFSYIFNVVKNGKKWERFCSCECLCFVFGQFDQANAEKVSEI